MVTSSVVFICVVDSNQCCLVFVMLFQSCTHSFTIIHNQLYSLLEVEEVLAEVVSHVIEPQLNPKGARNKARTGSSSDYSKAEFMKPPPEMQCVYVYTITITVL